MAEQELQLDPTLDAAALGAPIQAHDAATSPSRWSPAHGSAGSFRASGSRGKIPEGRLRAAIYRRDAIYRRTLALADVASAAIAVLIGVPILGHDGINPLALLALPLALIVAGRSPASTTATTTCSARAPWTSCPGCSRWRQCARWSCGSPRAPSWTDGWSDQVMALWALLFGGLARSRPRGILARAWSGERALPGAGEPRHGRRSARRFERRRAQGHRGRLHPARLAIAATRTRASPARSRCWAPDDLAGALWTHRIDRS